MNESLKACLGAVVLICLVADAILWFGVGPSNVIWSIRIGLLLLAATSLGVLVWAQNREDKAPDFLRQVTHRYFERDGLSFAIVPDFSDSGPALRIHYQNRYDRPCSGQIVIQLASGPLMATPGLSQISVAISCEAVAYGQTTIPWPLAHVLQGQTVTLHLAARVNYPHGRGRLLRYRDGLRVGALGPNWHDGLAVVGAVAGVILISRPGRLEVTIPKVLGSGMVTYRTDSQTLSKLP